MHLDWTVDYGSGPKPVQIPHVWDFERSVTWEGPAIYRCELDVPTGPTHLLFHGVSYEAGVIVNEAEVSTHRGIWDAFSIHLTPWAGTSVQIEVRVTKNGGESFPVPQTAAGFIPYVFHTFGGIFRAVELVQGEPDLHPLAPSCRVSIESGRILVDGNPFYARGILTWGWYPRPLPYPSPQVIEAETDQFEAMGFNLVKFCLWLPPHEYLEELNRRGIMAWIELPIWMPDPKFLVAMRQECLEIVRQYRRHPNILAWTAGCELSQGVDPEWRREFVEEIQSLTGHPLVKDNSGSAEMYGGHPAEFGTFNDFHPYCEPMFYPEVLAELGDGPRPKMPTLLGEFNDYDVFRPVHRWVMEPYWASSLEQLNAKGVRWQYDLPRILEECDGELGEWLEPRTQALIDSSLSQGAWMRQHAFDAARLQSDFDGWVLTGHRHTPISTSGVIGDSDELVYPVEAVREWTADARLLLFPRRTPPWINGGNRPGWEHPTVRFAGPCLFQAAAHSVHEMTGSLHWSIDGIAAGECPESNVKPLEVKQIGSFVIDLKPGSCWLNLEWAGITRRIQIQVVELLDNSSLDVLIPPENTIARPFFREACYAWADPIWEESGWRDNWDKLSLVAPDRALDPRWLDKVHPGWQPLLVRLDTRTFERLPVCVRSGNRIITTLRLEGGLGNQPVGIERNPAGQDLLRLFRKLVLN